LGQVAAAVFRRPALNLLTKRSGRTVLLPDRGWPLSGCCAAIRGAVVVMILCLPSHLMDKKSIIGLVVCIGVLVFWYTFMNKMYPSRGQMGGTNAVASATGTNVQAEAPSSSNAPSRPAAAPATPTTTATERLATMDTSATEHLIEVTNESAHYTFTSKGGGLRLVELLDYPETVATRRSSATTSNRVATLNTYILAPTLAIYNGEGFQGDNVFELSRNGNVIRAEKQLTNGLSIVKEFQISTNRLIEASIKLENKGSKELDLAAQEWVVGTATPMGPRDNGQAVGALIYDGSKTEDPGTSYFSPSGFLGCVRRLPPTDYRSPSTNVLWMVAHNQFFALAAMPRKPAVGAVVRPVPLPRATGDEASLVATNAPQQLGFEAALIYPELKLTPGQAVQREFVIFAGPKEYQTLARIADQFGNNVDLVMGFGGFWGFFSKCLLLAMNFLHQSIGVSYSLAIILITVILKVLFWPLTQASTRSMKRLQALQPQMNAIREKYKDDPVKMNRKTMEFMKENKVSPLGGCLPMVLQIPVFIGFYRMIQSAIELRGATFFWVKDLSKPDTLFVIPGLGFLPAIGVPGVGLPFNLLPLIMGATMLWQARLTPPSPGMDPTQQKIMRYLPLIFLVILYNFSAGLTLYWTVQNLLTIAQTKLTRTATDPAGAGAAPKAPVLTPPQKKRK
jgi:YidC/Oxa1 family membrane protein insertase